MVASGMVEGTVGAVEACGFACTAFVLFQSFEKKIPSPGRTFRMSENHSSGVDGSGVSFTAWLITIRTSYATAIHDVMGEENIARAFL